MPISHTLFERLKVLFDLLAFTFTFAISALLCAIAILRPSLLMRQDHMISDLTARQAQHTRPTPRVGGVAIVVAVFTGGLLFADRFELDLVLALLSGAVVFLVGLREDIMRNVSPRMRLLAAFISASLAIMLSGAQLPGLGIEAVDVVFQWAIVAIAITLLWSAGTCHALNLIDGLNGLASLYCVCAAGAICIIAGYTEDTDIQIVSGLLIAAVLGFFVFNWPLGRIFMGDASAYGIGHILAWLGLILIARNPEISGFAILLVLFWPVCETLFSMIRRRLNKCATDQPDRLHFHHLVVRALPLIFNRGKRRIYDNSLATIVILPFLVSPILIGLLFWDHAVQAAIGLVFFIALFIVTYVISMNYFVSLRFRKSNSAASQSHGRRGWDAA